MKHKVFLNGREVYITPRVSYEQPPLANKEGKPMSQVLQPRMPTPIVKFCRYSRKKLKAQGVDVLARRQKQADTLIVRTDKLEIKKQGYINA